MIQDSETNVYEILFVEKGKYAVGYKIGYEEHYAKKFQRRTVIGDWEVFNNKKTEFFYRAIEDVEGYIINKSDVFDMKEEFMELADLIQ
jgi:hypothetical protein